MAKIDRPINFRSSSSFEEVLSRAILHLDKDKSSVLRACVLVGLPTILAHPELVEMLGDGEVDVSNILVLLR
jgi:hypothetical protein